MVRDPKGRGAPQGALDPDGLRRFLISTSDRGWVTILPSGTHESGPDSLVAFLARELDTVAVWFERVNAEADEKLTYEVYWRNKRIDRQDPVEAGKLPSAYPTLIDHDLQSLGNFMPAGQKHPKLTVADLPRFYPKYAGDKSYIGRFKKLVTSADYPMLWGSYQIVWDPAAPEAERLESWGHLGFQREDGRSAAARLTHGDPAARRSAVEALASCAAEEARPGLQAALADDDAEVRLAAATVVAARPDKGLAQDLADRLADEDVRVRIAAARALKEMGVPQTCEPLQEVAGEDEVEVRRAAVAALANIDLPSARATLVAASKKDKDPEVRRYAAEGLGRAPLGDVAGDLARLLADKDPSVRATAARSAELATARPPKIAPKLVEALRKVATKDKDEATAAAAIRALRSLLPTDEQATDLAMKLYADAARTGSLEGLAVRLPREATFELRDKRILAALLKRLEKEISADLIVALGNQAAGAGLVAGRESETDPRIAETLKGLLPRLWPKDAPAPVAAAPAPEAPKKAAKKSAAPVVSPTAVAQTLREARAALPYALARLDDPDLIAVMLKILDLERHRKAPEDVAQAIADEPFRVQTAFAAMEAILERIPRAKPADLEKLNEKLASWIGIAADTLDAPSAVLRRVALLAYGRPTWKLQPAPEAAKPAKKPVEKAKGKPEKEQKPAPIPVVPPVLPNKAVIPIVRSLLNDPRWPEAAMVLARQLGPKATPVLVTALTRSIDKEVRLARKGGYSKRDSETIGNHRKGLVSALRELKDASAVAPLVRLLTLESLRAGKVERKAETSLLGVTVSALQTITGYKLGIEPQRWQEVAAGKVPVVEKKPAAKVEVLDGKGEKAKGKPAKKPVLVSVKAKPAAKKAPAKKPAPKKPVKKAKAAKKPIRKAAKTVKKPKSKATVKRVLKAVSKALFRKKTGSKKAPMARAARSARRR